LESSVRKGDASRQDGQLPLIEARVLVNRALWALLVEIDITSFTARFPSRIPLSEGFKEAVLMGMFLTLIHDADGWHAKVS
jgi:hypothetical protein